MCRHSKTAKPFDGPIRTRNETWRKAFTLNRKCQENGQRQRVFTCSMSDFFHKDADQWRDEAWEVIRSCKNLDWLILTKRPKLIAERLPNDWEKGYPNVWLGVTVEKHRHLERLDILAKIPAAVRFVSAEPLLEGVRFGRHIKKLDWVITGCEQAGKDNRRAMDLDWVRSIRDECDKADTPLFFKQYYSGTTLTSDGLLDGQFRQSHPHLAV